MNFYFRLQPLLNKEHIYENECIGRLRIVQDKIRHEEDKIKELERCKKASEKELKSKKKYEISAEELRAYESFFLKLVCDIISCDVEKQKISKELSAVQDELYEIIKRRKSLEKLKSRREEEHNIHMESLSNKELDDIAMTKFTNKLVMDND